MAMVHEGRRERVRERFRAEGLDAFAPHEVLELLLFYAKAQGDTNEIAHELIETFGSLRGVLEAEPRELQKVKGVGPQAAALIGLMVPMFRRYEACLAEERSHIGSVADAEAYCKAMLTGLKRERFCLIALAADGGVLGRRVVAEGTLSEVQAYPRQVTELALQLNAHSIVLCHNHPGGTATPSKEDIKTTALLRDLLSMLGITLLDHVIVADSRCYSMTAHGDLAGAANKRGGKR